MRRGENHRPKATNERHSLSQPFGLPAPSEREPGELVPSNVPPKNPNIAGDFHRPYESSEDFGFHRSSDDTPSVKLKMLPILDRKTY